MPKLNWEISQPGYGPQFNITANTRSEAIGKAEAQYMADHAWENEVVGELDDDGTPIARSPIPEYTAAKLGRIH